MKKLAILLLVGGMVSGPALYAMNSTPVTDPVTDAAKTLGNESPVNPWLNKKRDLLGSPNEVYASQGQAYGSQYGSQDESYGSQDEVYASQDQAVEPASAKEAATSVLGSTPEDTEASQS